MNPKKLKTIRKSKKSRKLSKKSRKTKKSKKPKTATKHKKINLRVSNKYNVKQLQERLDSAITKYRQQKEQRELQSSQDVEQNKIDGGEYQISNDVQVGGIQNTEIREVVQDQNIHTFDSNEIDTNYSVMYGGEVERDIKEISI